MSKIFIIAEAGVNHNGSIKVAKQMIDKAVESGVDAIKFQTFKAKDAVSINAQKAEYQMENTNFKETQYEMVKKLELDFEAHIELIAHCKQKGILFLSSPFDIPSINMLNELGLKIFKIPSGEIINLPYLRHLGILNKQIILSTGMANMGEIEAALDILVKAGTEKEKITILHANTEYPTPMADVNLNAMLTIGNTFKSKYGYSDHTKGIEISIAAAALGATVFEKHFTLDRDMEGPDHKASLEPKELKAMVKAIRNIEIALGEGIKKPSKSESKNIAIVRKSITAKQKIKKGDLFTEKNITMKRPGNGLSPMRWDEVIGTRANQDFLYDELIKI